MPDDGKVVLITGASTGIGAATARHAIDAGYRVALAARSTDKLQALPPELGGDGVALAVTTDVNECDEQERLAAAALERFGAHRRRLRQRRLRRARAASSRRRPEHWREMVLTNVLGAAYTIRATLPDLRERARAHPASPSRGRPPRAARKPLPATKHAVTAMGEACARRSTAPACASPSSSPAWSTRRSSTTARRTRLQADDVARAVMFAVAAAAAGRRQRDPRPPDGAGGLRRLDSGRAPPPWRRPSPSPPRRSPRRAATGARQRAAAPGSQRGGEVDAVGQRARALPARPDLGVAGVCTAIIPMTTSRPPSARSATAPAGEAPVSPSQMRPRERGATSSAAPSAARPAP